MTLQNGEAMSVAMLRDAKPEGPMQCVCGSDLPLIACCGRYLSGEPAPTAEAMMRSRYTAFTLRDEAYLLSTWHLDTRPQSLGLAQESPLPKWLGLNVLHSAMQDASHATVEFVARWKSGGRAHRLHELSRFVLEAGSWFYVDGDIA